jgi:acyl carrier protein
MDKRQFFEEIESILEIDPGTISGGENLKELGSWDSMAILTFIAMVDEKLGLALDPKSLKACVTPEDLLALCGNPVQG